MTDSARRTPGGPHAEAADRHPLAAALLSCLLCIIAGAPVRASALDAITAMPQTAEIADLTGYWQFIPIPLPERSEGSSKRTKPSFSNPSRAPVRPAEKGAQARRNGQASGPPLGQHSHPCRPRPERRHPRRHPASGRRRFGEPRPRRNCQARQSSHRRWRQGDRHFRPQSRDSLPRRAGAGKPAPAAPHLHINNVNPITAVLSSGSTASTASPPRTCPIISAGGALSKPGATNSNRQPGSKALSGTDPTNR